MVQNFNFCHSWYLAFQDVHWNHAKFLGDFEDLEALLWASEVLDPTTNISADKAHLVLGGEGCMWGETVDAWTAFQLGGGMLIHRVLAHGKAIYIKPPRKGVIFHAPKKKIGGKIIPKTLIKNKYAV